MPQPFYVCVWKSRHAWLKLDLSTADLKLSKGPIWRELPNFLLDWANGAHFYDAMAW